MNLPATIDPLLVAGGGDLRSPSCPSQKSDAFPEGSQLIFKELGTMYLKFLPSFIKGQWNISSVFPMGTETHRYENKTRHKKRKLYQVP